MALLETILKMYKKEIKKYENVSRIAVFLLMVITLLFLLAVLLTLWIYLIFVFRKIGVQNVEIVSTGLIFMLAIITYFLMRKKRVKNK